MLDPILDDGIAHIHFRPVAGRWIPIPRDGSIRGYETIRRVQLDRADLLELYDTVVRDLQDSIARIRDSMAQAIRPPSAPVSAVWAEVLRAQLRHGAPLVGLRYDVFEYHFPRTVRAYWGVSLDEFAAALTHRRTGA